MTLASPSAVQQKIEARLQALFPQSSADASAVDWEAKASRVVIQDVASEITTLSEEESAEQFLASVNSETCVKLVKKSRRLILAFQSLEDDTSVLCAALQAYEFNCYSSPSTSTPTSSGEDNVEELCQRIVYLAKVDTTGLAEPRSLQRPLVHALIHGYLEAQSSMVSCPIRIHVLSTSNPEYLFPCSQKLPEKRPLDGKRLMYWWKKVLTEVKGQRYWWVPGLEYGILPREHRQDCRDGSLSSGSAPIVDVTATPATTTSAATTTFAATMPSSTWTWGYPYDQDASAMSVVPVFPDDAKSACLKRAVHDKSVSVKSFFQGVLENASEFHRSDVGIFVVCVAGRQTEMAVANDTMVEDTPSQECLTQLEKCLNLADSAENKCVFSTVEEAKASSQSVRDLLMKYGRAWNLLAIRVPPLSTTDQEGPGKKREAAAVEAPTIVHMLTVKRKKKS